MKYAQVSQGVVIEVVSAAAHDTFNPTVQALFMQCPDQVTQGYTFTAPSTWTAPATPAPTPAPLAVLKPMQFYLAFTPSERIAIKTSADAQVAEFWATYQLAAQTDTPIDPNLVSVQEGVQYLRAHGILATDARVSQVLAGTPQ